MSFFHPRALVALFLLAPAACSDSTGPSEQRPTRGVVVLHAIGALKGVSAGDTMAAGVRIPLPQEYDGAGMRLESDTVLTTSSSFGTNKLYIVAVPSQAVAEVEMPAGANAAGAALAHGFRGARVAVALRSTASLALVNLGGSGAPTTSLVQDVGRCPYDVAAHDGGLWIVDYNGACNTNYANLGDSRLIRVAATGAARDTIALSGVKNATSIIVAGDVAYVGSIGVADYSAFPAVSFITPGSITVVDLRTRQVRGTVSLPAGTNGARLSLGRDGKVYVVAYTSTAYEQGVFAIDPETLGFTGVRAAGSQALRLTSAAGAQVRCAAATADAARRLYCAVNQGVSMSTSLSVFDLTTGSELRSYATGGTGALDLALQ